MDQRQTSVDRQPWTIRTPVVGVVAIRGPVADMDQSVWFGGGPCRYTPAVARLPYVVPDPADPLYDTDEPHRVPCFDVRNRHI